MVAGYPLSCCDQHQLQLSGCELPCQHTMSIMTRPLAVQDGAPHAYIGVACIVSADIRAALKSKDEEYVKLLKRQAADVDTLVGAMSRQLADLVSAYREELENVERALLQVFCGVSQQLLALHWQPEQQLMLLRMQQPVLVRVGPWGITMWLDFVLVT